jgi:hypothetical protein
MAKVGGRNLEPRNLLKKEDLKRRKQVLSSKWPPKWSNITLE